MLLWRHRRGRGAAIIEFVMIVPLVALIIGLTFFFGWSMKNQQRLRVASRYAVWRAVHNRGAAADGLAAPPNLVEVDFDRLNAAFLDVAAAVGPDAGSRMYWDAGPEETILDLAAAAGTPDRPARRLAEDIAAGHLPRGLSAVVLAEFPSSVGLWKNLGLTGLMESRHVREGVEWRRRQAAYEYGDPAGGRSVLEDEFLGSLGGTLSIIPGGGDELGRAFRRLYLAGW